ncbi:hypothetical protein N657DRAFT_584336 [Parathielavia appendiculata]|uniref:Uncharacterized protein n=1 Tax=Parathielavia appendiculata TaxID=2587402 RepID=A0AAN6YXS0_9PEZI|nr:hypothetical protein N657DRAFT_584336 [Parathielavia appendiculata]
MRGDSGSPGVGCRRPQRKRVKTKRAMESMQQDNDMDWEEENSIERVSRNHKNRTVGATAAERADEGIRGAEQPADRDFNNNLDIIKAEVQMQFKKIIAEEVAKMTAQLTEELSQARDQLTRACHRGNINRIRILGRNEEEVKKIKDIMEAKKTPGARVLRDQLYPVKVDNVNRTAVIDHEGRVLPGATEALSQETRCKSPRWPG